MIDDNFVFNDDALASMIIEHVEERLNRTLTTEDLETILLFPDMTESLRSAIIRRVV